MSVANHVAHHAEPGEPSQEFLQKVQRTKSRRSVTKSLYVQKQTNMKKKLLVAFYLFPGCFRPKTLSKSVCQYIQLNVFQICSSFDKAHFFDVWTRISHINQSVFSQSDNLCIVIWISLPRYLHTQIYHISYMIKDRVLQRTRSGPKYFFPGDYKFVCTCQVSQYKQ